MQSQLYIQLKCINATRCICTNSFNSNKQYKRNDIINNIPMHTLL